MNYLSLPVVCLTTADRPDRLERIRTQVQPKFRDKFAFLQGPTTLIGGLGDDKDRMVGGAMGHCRAVLEGMKRFGFPFLLLEDDVEFPPRNPRPDEDDPLPDGIDALHLGVSRYGWDHAGSRSMSSVEGFQVGRSEIFRVFNMLSTHAVAFLTMDYAAAYVAACTEAAVRSAYSEWTVWDTMTCRLADSFQVYAVKWPLFVQCRHVGGAEGTDGPLIVDPRTNIESPFMPRDRAIRSLSRFSSQFRVL